MKLGIEFNDKNYGNKKIDLRYGNDGICINDMIMNI